MLRCWPRTFRLSLQQLRSSVHTVSNAEDYVNATWANLKTAVYADIVSHRPAAMKMKAEATPTRSQESFSPAPKPPPMKAALAQQARSRRERETRETRMDVDWFVFGRDFDTLGLHQSLERAASFRVLQVPFNFLCHRMLWALLTVGDYPIDSTSDAAYTKHQKREAGYVSLLRAPMPNLFRTVVCRPDQALSARSRIMRAIVGLEMVRIQTQRKLQAAGSSQNRVKLSQAQPYRAGPFWLEKWPFTRSGSTLLLRHIEQYRAIRRAQNEPHRANRSQ
ncbi:hypothetical protein K438DRAFT_1940683 [Mycena galopus ATCC 62051]|nr:hypothetical protein K438DRAFT_1940683 [Mycena galopus ATCC 62051]